MTYKEVYEANRTNGRVLCAIDNTLKAFIEAYERFIFENSTFENFDGKMIASVPKCCGMSATIKDD